MVAVAVALAAAAVSYPFPVRRFRPAVPEETPAGQKTSYEEHARIPRPVAVTRACRDPRVRFVRDGARREELIAA